MSSNLVMSDEMSDVTLRVIYRGYTWRFPAHSLLLISRSSVFREMIEDRQDHEVPVSLTLTNTDPDAIQQILRYIYTGQSPSNVTSDLLVSAKKFGLTDLREQLEDQLLPSLDAPQACELLEGFDLQEPLSTDCSVKDACVAVLERNAYRVFASDLIFQLNRRTLTKLLESDHLNVPDESVLFGGIWRWGRRNCSQLGKPIDDETVAGYLADLLGLLRLASLRRRDDIPEVALKSFHRCLPRRCAYEPPGDSHCSVWQTCDHWNDLMDVGKGEQSTLCLQISFDNDVMLVGVELEICAPSQDVVHLQVFRECDGKELSRQRISCFQCSLRKLNWNGDAEHWMKSKVILSEPLILSRTKIYSVYLRTDKETSLPRGPVDRKKRLGNGFATLHGQTVVSVRELNLLPDFKATWGPEPTDQ